MERTRRAIADADLLLVVVDGSLEMSAEDLEVFAHAEGRGHVIVRNKCDVPTFLNDENKDDHAINVSALTGTGLEDLRVAIIKNFGGVASEDTGVLITNARHHDLLRNALEGLKSASNLWDTKATEELTLVGLHNALQFLGQITGETTTEDLVRYLCYVLHWEIGHGI